MLLFDIRLQQGDESTGGQSTEARNSSEVVGASLEDAEAQSRRGRLGVVLSGQSCVRVWGGSGFHSLDLGSGDLWSSGDVDVGDVVRRAGSWCRSDDGASQSSGESGWSSRRSRAGGSGGLNLTITNLRDNGGSGGRCSGDSGDSRNGGGDRELHF